MCVYSVEASQSRPAKVGESLVVKQFPHAVGFCPAHEPEVAACVLPGSEIAFDQVITAGSRPGLLERLLYLGSPPHPVSLGFAVAKFVRRGNFDDLELPDGRRLGLYRLTPGQRLRVVQLPASGAKQDDVPSVEPFRQAIAAFNPRETAHL